MNLLTCHVIATRIDRMKFRYSTARIILFIIVSRLLPYEAKASEWPENISNSMWVPQNAFDIKRNAYPLDGVYSVAYKMNLCQPASSFTKGMVSHMTAIGWKRLDEDPFNAGLKLNHARKPHARWDIYHHGPGGYYVMQWMDDWRDPEGNFARYALRFKGERIEDLTEACILEINVLYTPEKRMKEYTTYLSHWEEKRKREEAEWIKSRKEMAEIFRRESKLSGKITFRLVKENAPLSGNTIEYDASVPSFLLNVAAANVIKRENQDTPMIEVLFTTESAVRVKEFSSKYRGRKIAIVVDNEVIWMPRLMDTIEDIATLRGKFSPERAKEIVNRIMAQ